MKKDDGSLPIPKDPGKQTEEMFLQSYKKSFFSAVKWNTFESIAYQLIFVAHQVGLFTYCDSSLYGKAGVLFSFSYLIITILIAGLDGGLLPFFKSFTAHKKSFSYLVRHYIKSQSIFIIASSLVGMALLLMLSPFHSFDYRCIFLVGLFVIAEGIKKLLKHILYLAFYNRYTALLEVLQIALYVGTIWILHWTGVPFSLSLFFVPFIFLSLLSNACCVYLLFSYYQTLPSESNQLTLPPHVAFITTRASVLINQLCRSFFTSNFLVPLFSFYGGFAQAGILTFANYLTHACTFFIHKVCVPPAEALLSRVKNFSLSSHYKAFQTVLLLFVSITTLLGILLLLKGRSFATLAGHPQVAHLSWALFFFFFFVHLLESMFILYEKFFLLQERAGLLAVGNLLTCAVCFAFTWFSFSFFSVVLTCIFIRFLFFFFLSLIVALSKPAPKGRFQGRFRRWPLLEVFYFDDENVEKL